MWGEDGMKMAHPSGGLRNRLRVYHSLTALSYQKHVVILGADLPFLKKHYLNTINTVLG
jgi:glycosyltransferase A (GT-A) superfamily protein (DUF2064 family)